MSNWQQNTNDFERIKQGSPSSYWSYGLQKRFEAIQKYVSFDGKKLLDVGCGLGEFIDKFIQIGADAYGIEVDPAKVAMVKPELANRVILSGAEKLPFDDNSFDIAFSHEVLEHVNDDEKAVAETMRILKPGGHFVVFCPNRAWPFETHGIFWKGKYKFGNKFGVTYLPDRWYKKLTPHVRNYSNRKLLQLFKPFPHQIVVHKHVFPGFDGLVKRAGILGKLSRKFLDAAESTPLHFFGISHLLIVKKI